jgi:hypothetical protein
MTPAQQMMALGWATGQACRTIGPWLWMWAQHKGTFDPKHLKETGAAFMAGLVADAQLGPLIPTTWPASLVFLLSACAAYIGQDGLSYVRKLWDVLNLQKQAAELPAKAERKVEELVTQLEKDVKATDVPAMVTVLVEQKVEEHKADAKALVEGLADSTRNVADDFDRMADKALRNKP